ncbi:MAG: NAD(P)-dependent dehydrogenase (short-subunit alcohol dehydrogenase family) [Candidatus Azotimanducaceae bacterium]|jgi:NAD(P)-dependent dehydrogenase (short-subunit alcohol dehydrogenase family)
MASQLQKIALITGAGSGIGASAARALSAAGFTLVLTGRRKARLSETAESCAGPTLQIESDVSVPESVENLFAAIESEFSRLDVLFNNAGGGSRPAPLDEISVKDWQRVINVNLTGTFLCSRSAFNLMKNQRPMGGRIINNGSISAHAPRPGSAPYTASKHAITGLTKSTSLDGRPYNIVCGQIDIGNALTEMTARIGEGVPQADGSIQPEPTMDVDHVGAAVAQMAALPLESNIQFMTIMASKMPLIGRG